MECEGCMESWHLGSLHIRPCALCAGCITTRALVYSEMYTVHAQYACDTLEMYTNIHIHDMNKVRLDGDKKRRKEN